MADGPHTSHTGNIGAMVTNFPQWSIEHSLRAHSASNKLSRPKGAPFGRLHCSQFLYWVKHGWCGVQISRLRFSRLGTRIAPTTSARPWTSRKSPADR